MDIGIISLVISTVVAAISILSFINTISVKKEGDLSKLARATDVDSQLILVRKDINTILSKLEDHGMKISLLQISEAVLKNQMATELRELEKLGDKIDEWREDGE